MQVGDKFIYIGYGCQDMKDGEYTLEKISSNGEIKVDRLRHTMTLKYFNEHFKPKYDVAYIYKQKQKELEEAKKCVKNALEYQKTLKKELEEKLSAIDNKIQELSELLGGELKPIEEDSFEEMRQFCEDGVYEELYDALGTDKNRRLYLEEHRKQRNNPSFGVGGKMSDKEAGYYYSGLTWSTTTQGQYFWDKIFYK